MGRVALLFPYDQIRISSSILIDIGSPQYIRIFVDKTRRKLYIRACEKAPDAFFVSRAAIEHRHTGLSIASVSILPMLFDFLGLEDRSLCIRFRHRQVDYKTIEVDLDDYRPTHKEKKEKRKR